MSPPRRPEAGDIPAGSLGEHVILSRGFPRTHSQVVEVDPGRRGNSDVRGSGLLPGEPAEGLCGHTLLRASPSHPALPEDRALFRLDTCLAAPEPEARGPAPTPSPRDSDPSTNTPAGWLLPRHPRGPCPTHRRYKAHRGKSQPPAQGLRASSQLSAQAPHTAPHSLPNSQRCPPPAALGPLQTLVAAAGAAPVLRPNSKHTEEQLRKHRAGRTGRDLQARRLLWPLCAQLTCVPG